MMCGDSGLGLEMGCGGLGLELVFGIGFGVVLGKGAEEEEGSRAPWKKGVGVRPEEGLEYGLK